MREPLDPILQLVALNAAPDGRSGSWLDWLYLPIDIVFQILAAACG